jgi:plasmid stabilization system protein ParE
MSGPLRILVRAREDVDAIFDWLVHRSVRGAISWYLAFGRAVRDIAESPQRYGEAPESGPLGRTLLQCFFKTRRGRNYRIIFELSLSEISCCAFAAPVNRRYASVICSINRSP